MLTFLDMFEKPYLLTTLVTLEAVITNCEFQKWNISGVYMYISLTNC